ncbi:energy transducer TonB [Emcibacter nanhaiensis]|uniref:Energy transducer TonB n=1 Tax=Emcibacter nanhaiensis TaxID=1505037 RepID=A0A501PNQ4_9PROT|nr:energy transducer TonB [Emcibacter nanhaiensis]TPD61905.1 energy transducer TonB [Emcibacter nanhaiensis]
MRRYILILFLIIQVIPVLAYAVDRDKEQEFLEALSEYNKAWETSRDKEAYDHAKRAYILSQELYDEGSKQQFYATKNFAMARGRLGDREALGSFYEALGDAQGLFEENSPEMLDVYVGLGKSSLSVFDLKKARKYLGKAEDVFKKYFPKNLAVEAEILTATSSIDIFRRKYRSAGKKYERLLDIHLQLYGDEHLVTALFYQKIAGFYDSRGKIHEALEFRQKAHSILMAKLPEDSAEIRASHIGLLASYDGLRNEKEALKHCLEISRLSDDITETQMLPVLAVAPKKDFHLPASKAEVSVVIEFTAGADCRVHDARIAEGNRAFGKAAVKAVEKMRFPPRLVDGKPVSTPGLRHEMTFTRVN